MTRQASFDGGEQGDILTRFRVKSNKGRTGIAALLGMEADTYRRYEIGQTELKVSQVRPFARAYGISPIELVGALGLLEEDEDAGWSMADALRSYIPEGDIPVFVQEWEGRTILEQKAAARGIIRNADWARERATKRLENHRTA